MPTPHFPRPVPIEAYGNGGFRFAGMSHKGSILCLPSGVSAWPVIAPDGVTPESLAAIFAEKSRIHRTYVGGVERGERNPTLDVLERLARALGISAGQLLSEEESP